ncbi:hypothetical protein Golax_003681 [Gossypium laxum]|uniref:Uncharacterized protein n=1 Tax=Gossypium laxum TaxID=34288 RepID=A0A7J9AHY6_9ROSI|nr:hypothetical protein [Gossypium laxum]
MPLEPRASWFSPKCDKAQQLTGHLGGLRSASETMGDKLYLQEGNSLDHQLRPLNDHSVIKEVGVQRQREAATLERNAGLSNANIGENPMPRKSKGSFARFMHGGTKEARLTKRWLSIQGRKVPVLFRVRRGRENALSQCSSTLGKAQTTFNKRCWKVKEVGDLIGKPTTEASVNGGSNYNGPKVAKFLIELFLCSLGGRRRRPPSGGPEPSASQKVMEACKGFLGLDGDWPSSAKAEGSLTARPTRRAWTKVGLSDLTVPSGGPSLNG